MRVHKLLLAIFCQSVWAPTSPTLVNIETLLRDFLEQQYEFLQQTFLIGQQQLLERNLKSETQHQELTTQLDRLRIRLKGIQEQQSQDVDKILAILEGMNKGIAVEMCELHKQLQDLIDQNIRAVTIKLEGAVREQVVLIKVLSGGMADVIKVVEQMRTTMGLAIHQLQQVLQEQLFQMNVRFATLSEAIEKIHDRMVLRELLEVQLSHIKTGIRELHERSEEQGELMDKMIYTLQNSDKLITRQRESNAILNTLNINYSKLERRIENESIELRRQLLELRHSIEEIRNTQT